MVWLLLSFITACAEGVKDLVSKRTMRTASPALLAWALPTSAAPLLVIAALSQPIPSIGALFLPALAATFSIYVVALFLYMKALQASDLSLTLPMIAFTPAFMLLTGPLVLGEMPPPLGIAGVVTIVVGAYLLKFEDFRGGLLRPIVSLVREPGPRYMLGVAFLFSITATTAKLAISQSSPLFSMSAMYLCSATAMTIIMLARRKLTKDALVAHWKGLIAIGVLVAIAEACLAVAISMTLAVYVISAKRLSILIGAILGFIVFKEKNIASRLLGALVMLAGLALIAFSER